MAIAQPRGGNATEIAEAYADVAARLDRLPFTRVQRGILVRGGLTTTFDGMDNGIVSFLLPIVTGAFALSGFEQGLLGSSALIGAIAGAAAVGVLGDRIGRRNLLLWSMAFYSAAMLVGAFATSGGFLVATRVAAGVAIGINVNIIVPYLAEFAPVRRRGHFVGSLAGFFGLGFVLAALIGYLVIQHFDQGWRIALIVVGAPIVLAVWWRRKLPESPRYLVSRGRIEEATRVVERLEARVRASLPGGELPRPDRSVDYAPEKHLSRNSLGAQLAALFRRSMLRQTVLVIVLWFCFSFTYYGFLVFLPTLLVQRGLSISESFGYTIVVEIAQVAGYYPAAWLSERLDRKWSIVIFLSASALSAVGLAFAQADAQVVVFAVALAFFLNGAYAPLYTYTPEVYPTWIRATGVGVSAVFGRFGAALAPIAMGTTYASLRFSGVFLVLCGVIALAVGSVVVLGVATRQRSLEQIAG
ncbi:MFS transporter [Pseudonocardia acaciae]|uniref:MFS transporter n=1 Tax=Pseudonocardia acaciae TaxID=551276 RepID=UPI000683D852|nr:MFS transporter [Pseudonocardia acaciae]